MKIHKNSMTGDAGIAVIHARCIQMGFVWTPRTLEAGIDGQIEVRDDVTGEVKNCVLHVQSKAVDQHFRGESEDSVEFTFEEKHINYWMGGNGPVIVVVSRPSTNEAYWKDVKAWFKDPSRRASRKVVFDRRRDVFDASAKSALIELAEPEDSGLYFAPDPIDETLTSNMVPVAFGRGLLYTAVPTETAEEAFDRAADAQPEEACWTIHEDLVLSFEDLSQPRFRPCVEAGTVERHGIEEWSDADDHERLRLFVQLLNRTLRAHLVQHDVNFSIEKRNKYYYFAPNDGLRTRHWTYRMLRLDTKRAVFERYKKPDGRTKWCRHSALRAYFVKVGDGWFLEIVPHYRFTTDGVHSHPNSPELLKKIKLLEKNNALLGQVHMWVDVLSRNEGLFDSGSQILKFGDLVEFRLGVGIPEARWLEVDETDEQDGEFGGLFD